MMENNELSICIPTFNRADVLKSSLLELVSAVKDIKLPIYVSDNCSTDNTELVVFEVKQKYGHIHYFKQNKNIYDENFDSVLKQSLSRYAWLISDKTIINALWIPKILEIIKSDNFDCVVVNTEGGRVKDIPSQVYSDCNKLLIDLGWHMTLISSLIFSRRMIDRINFDRFTKTNFRHVAGIFEAIANREFKILWINEPVLLNSKKTAKSGWSDITFSVFFDIWANSILSLPPVYTLNSKLQCIKKHGVCSGLFSLKGFLRLRRDNIYKFSVFKKYRIIFNYFTNVPRWILFLISLTPPIVIMHTICFFQKRKKSSCFFSDCKQC